MTYLLESLLLVGLVAAVIRRGKVFFAVRLEEV